MKDLANKITGSSTVVQATVLVTAIVQIVIYVMNACGLPPMGEALVSALTGVLMLVSKPLITKIMD